MRFPNKSLLARMVVWAVAVSLLPLCASAKTKRKATPAHKVPLARQSSSQRVTRQSSRRTTVTSRRSREARRQHRLARLRLEPERVAEIQRALTQAGYLNQVPTGRWDEPTRQAMRRYQGEHGFSTTGLPEAKSLMKLGLGPHPLPPELDLTAAPQASMDSGGNPRPSIDQPNSQGSPSPGSSPENNL